MPLSNAIYDPETLDLMSRALDEACGELSSGGPLSLAEETRKNMAARILSAAAEGERNPCRLRQAALQG